MASDRDPDAELVDLCAELIVVEAERYRLAASEDFQAVRAAGARVAALCGQIDAIIPATLDGLAVKVRAAWSVACAGETAPRPAGIEDQLAFSVLRDLAAAGPRFFGRSPAASLARARRSLGSRSVATPASTSR